jgi:phosphoadenosine phosphosulfate reductase
MVTCGASTRKLQPCGRGLNPEPESELDGLRAKLRPVPTNADPTASPQDLEELDAEGVLEYLVDRFHPRLTVACSFQKEASVILDLLLRIAPDARVFTLDTHVLFPETYETWKRIEDRYGIEVQVFQGPSIARQAALRGDRLWERDPDACCAIRKVDPLNRALEGMDAWISGLRRDQSPSRADTPKLAWDSKHGLWKANPLADWSEADVWRHIIEHDVPYNPLHDQGYSSIGCTHCTTPGTGRDGRWAGDTKTECGIHAA